MSFTGICGECTDKFYIPLPMVLFLVFILVCAAVYKYFQQKRARLQRINSMSSSTNLGSLTPRNNRADMGKNPLGKTTLYVRIMLAQR